MATWGTAGCATSTCGCKVAPIEVSVHKKGLTPSGGVPYHEMIQYRAKDAKPAIMQPVLVDAEAAVLAPGTKVIGVSIGGESRAYPLFILNNHQIVNDQVGGIPISASW
jgi:hypothetical protein